jgi:hypothetical protein
MTKYSPPKADIDCDDLLFPGTDAEPVEYSGQANGWEFDYIDHQGNPDSFFSPYTRLDKAIEYFESRVEGLPVIVNHELKKMNYQFD